jgi:hypothetical protein
MRVAIGEETTERTAATNQEEIVHPKILIAAVTGTMTTDPIAGEGRETVLARQAPNEAGVPTAHRAPSRHRRRNLAVRCQLKTSNSVVR